MQITDSDRQRFWAKVLCGAPNTCWLWRGAIDTHGYGKIWLKGHWLGAHRFSYVIAYGEIANRLCVLHKCDNPSCVNPAHLWLGTYSDNMNDCIAKGRDMWVGTRHWSHRHPERVHRGSRHWAAKLNEKDIIRIRYERACGKSGAALARELGVSSALVCKVIKGVIWKEVV